MDSANLNAIISAVSGLTGVGIGALLTHLRELRTENIKDKRDTSYLAILVVPHLDRFANGCMSVAFDDGTSEGRPAGEDGVYHRTTVRPPEFKPLDIKVEWRVLPRELMYDILEIPARQEHMENQLSGVMEFDDPPEYAGSSCVVGATTRNLASGCQVSPSVSESSPKCGSKKAFLAIGTAMLRCKRSSTNSTRYALHMRNVRLNRGRRSKLLRCSLRRPRPTANDPLQSVASSTHALKADAGVAAGPVPLATSIWTWSHVALKPI